MSMVYCDECDSHIDLDFHSEHFISEHESKELAGRCAERLTDEEVETLQ